MLPRTKFTAFSEAEIEDVTREHSGCASFPVNNVAEINAIIEPSTAE